MTIVCAWCGQREGKLACFRCGEHLTAENLRVVKKEGQSIKICNDCADAGDRARPSVSHTICSRCEARFR